MILEIHNWAEISAALICTMCLIYKPSVLNRWFVLFLWVTVVIELIGKLTTPFPWIKIPMYNIWNGTEFIFYFLFFLSVVERKKTTQVFIVCLMALICFFLYNILFFQGLYLYNNHTHTLGSVFMIFSCLLFLYEIASSETEHFTVLKGPLLFIIFGILIYYAGNVSNTAVYNYLSKNDPKEAWRLYRLINHNLNLVLYPCFCIAFILEISKNKKLHIS